MFHHEPVYDDATLYSVLQDTVRYAEIMREGAAPSLHGLRWFRDFPVGVACAQRTSKSKAVPRGGWSCTRMLRWCASGQGRPATIMATVMLAVCQVWLGERYWEPVRHIVFDTYQQVLPACRAIPCRHC